MKYILPILFRFIMTDEKLQRSQIYFKTNVLGYGDWIDEKLGIEGAENLRSGSSVSNLSLDIARYMGCNPIIVIGQNLSFPNLESYADGAVLKQEQDRHIQQCVENSNKYYVLEKDIDVMMYILLTACFP